MERRKNRTADLARARAVLRAKYERLDPDIFQFDQKFLHPKFLSVSNRPSLLAKSLGPGVFSFPVFTAEFCRSLVSEVRHFRASGLPFNRANTMNKQSVLLDELGLSSFVDALVSQHLQGICHALFGGAFGTIDSHKSFVVIYSEGGDKELAAHYDNSEVTLNVSLSESHSEGELVFRGLRTEEERPGDVFGYSHVFSEGLLHRGAHVHEALPISEGERWNLILWLRSSEVRNALCPMCNEKPDLEEVESGTGDGFTRVGR